jgi:autotransporter-associated beta strand protein
MDNIRNAYVWQEGALIDTDGKDVTIRQGLSAPTGSGITSIPLTAGGSGYVAHPVVEITGGGGTGAAAVALLDASGTVTGIRVTNPGIGYTSAPTINLRGGGTTTPATVGAATLGANVGGGLTKIGAGTLTLGGPNTYTGPTAINAGTLRLGGPATAGLTHRYSFTSDANDSVGAAHGALINGATVTGGRVVLANSGTQTANNTVGGGQYVDLPNNIARTSSLTLEGWATWNTASDWQRIFDFGNNSAGEQLPGSGAINYNGVSTIYLAPRTGNDPGNGRLSNLGVEHRVSPISRFANARSPSNTNQAFAFPSDGSEHQFAVTKDAATDTLSLYFDGQLVGQNTAAIEDLALVEMVNMWLGRSNWAADPFYAGSIDEFRIYDNALTAAGVAANFAAGPDGAISNTFTGIPQADYLPVATPVTIAAGATLDLANLNARIGSLSGPAGSTVQLGSGTLTTGGDNSSTSFSGNINGTGGLTKEGTGTFTLPTAQPYSGATTVNGGTLRVSGSIASSSGVTVNTGGTFEAAATQTINGLTLNTGGKAVITADGPAKVLRINNNALNLAGGQLDVTDNGVVIDHSGSSPIAAVRTALSSGYAGGPWNGPGIITSNGQTNSSQAVGYAEAATLLGAGGGDFMGQPVDGTAVLLRHTLFGDANLDTNVNFTDLVALAQNYGDNTGNAVWTQGDFTYDGNVDFSDLVKLAQNYGTSLPSAAQLEGIGAGAGFQDDLAAAFAQVPEPGTLALFGLAAGALAARRRRSPKRS